VTAPIRLVVIDDQKLIRSGLVMLLDAEDDIEVVGEAEDGRAGLDLVRALTPDVALMDIRMPVMDGIAATHRIVLDTSLPTRVLVLTTFDTDEAVLDAMKAGASGFLLKDADPDDIVRAVRNVAAGDAVLAPSAMRRLLDAVGPSLRAGLLDAPDPAAAAAAAAPVSAQGPAPATPPAAPAIPPKLVAAVGSLTEREREVLGLVGEGLTNAEIAQRLFLADTTVKTHVHRIMGKLQARDRVQTALIAHRAGLVAGE
jgi:DNA-binding NarL/FixJ family response regulator